MATWQERVKADLVAKQRPKKSRYINLAKLERKKDGFGRWLRTGRRVDPGDRDVVHVSIPGDLANKILAEAQDNNYPYSRLIVVLAALGLPVFQQARDEILAGHRETYVPKLVEAVVKRVYARPRAEATPGAIGWRSNIEEQLQAAALDKKQKRQAADPTEIALRQFKGE